MLTPFQVIAVILTLSAAGGYLNHRFLRFPPTIGLMAFAFAGSLGAIALSRLGWIDLRPVGLFVQQINFSDVVLHGMLSFLLFAGALHINVEELRSMKWSVAILATAGVVIATFIVGGAIWLAAGFVGLALPFLDALLFGALISPTDPIAILAILKDAGISRRLYTKIGSESLFNDGVGVVVFLTILGFVSGGGVPKTSEVAILFLQQAGGGAVLGLIFGWITYRLLRSIDQYKVEILLTLALVSAGYLLAELAHVSAPIAMVTAGLVVGHHGRNLGMSELSRARLDDFWELVDEILNAALFVLVGLEVIVISVTLQHVLLGIFAVIAVLLARLISVGLPVAALSLRTRFERGTVAILTWGGLRGGLCLAMALALPAGPARDIVLPITYIVVLFSILVQGLTFKPSLKVLLKLP